MRKVALLFAPLFLSFIFLSHQDLFAQKSWDIVYEEQIKGVSIELKILDAPNLSDTSWIALEFENHTDQPLMIEDAFYKIDCRVYESKSNKEVRTGCLTSRSPAEVLDQTFAGPIPTVNLQPGKTVTTAYPSAFASALIGMPADEYRIDANINLMIKFNVGKTFTFNWEDIEFDFYWKKSSAAELAIMKLRLNKLLERPEISPYQHHILYTLLSIDDISKDLSVDRLLMALQERSGKEDGRLAIIYFLNQKYNEDKELLTYYTEQLNQKNPQALTDLAEAPEIWDNRFLEPLIELYQSGNTGLMFRVMDVLYAHQKFWIKEEGISSILSDLILYKYEDIIYESPDRLSDENLLIWGMAVSMLGKTGNREVIPLICPYLNNKSRILDGGIVLDPESLDLPRPIRVCDNVLDALLRLQDKDLEKAYRKAGFEPPYSYGEAEIVVTRIRDKMIKDLKKKGKVCK